MRQTWIYAYISDWHKLYIVFFTERSISIETLCLLIGTYPILAVKHDYKMSRVCLRFELPIENTDSKSHIFRSYRRYRRYRWTSYFGGSVYQCSVGGHETKVYITDGVLIYPSVRAEKNSLLTVNCLYYRYRRYRWTRFSRATSCPWNNANYLCFTKGFYTFTDGLFISPSVRTDNLALPTVNCLYHPYRRYQWTRFPKATSCPWTKDNTCFTKRF